MLRIAVNISCPKLINDSVKEELDQIARYSAKGWSSCSARLRNGCVPSAHWKIDDIVLDFIIVRCDVSRKIFLTILIHY